MYWWRPVVAATATVTVGQPVTRRRRSRWEFGGRDSFRSDASVVDPSPRERFSPPVGNYPTLRQWGAGAGSGAWLWLPGSWVLPLVLPLPCPLYPRPPLL